MPLFLICRLVQGAMSLIIARCSAACHLNAGG